MRGRNDAPGRRPLLVGALFLTGLLAAAGLPRTAAQDATPATDAGASPVAIASPGARTADCATTLGLDPGSACLLLVHAAAGVPDIDLYVDDEPAVEGLAFGAASPFLGLAPGEHQVQITEAGAPPADALLALALPLEAGLAYEVAALATADGPTAAILSTNLDPLVDDRARVRVFQAIPGAPPAEVALAGGETVIPDIEYGSATGYAEVPAGATPVDLEVRAAGGAVVFPLPGTTLEPGLVYTFYALGDIADPATLAVLPVTAPASGSAQAGGAPPAAAPIPLTPGTSPAATPAA
jgi:hypothetical protein